MGAEINLVPPEDYHFIDLLLQWGADPNSYDRNGTTPLMKAGKTLESVLILLAGGADVNAIATSRQDCRTVLHYAVLGGNPVIVNLLLKQGANVNMADDYAYPTPLDMAILRDDFDMVSLLVRNSADVNFFSRTFGSPLHVASAAKLTQQFKITRYLLEHGADVNKGIRFGDEFSGSLLRTPLVEYFNSRQADELDVAFVAMLLRHGAKIAFTRSNRWLWGIVRYDTLANISRKREFLSLLVSVADDFDIHVINVDHLIPDKVKKIILDACCNPLPLRHVIRRELRRHLRNRYAYVIGDLPLPNRLKAFLNFEFS